MWFICALPEGATLRQCTRGINHTSASLFLHWQGFLKGCKNTLFVLFVVNARNMPAMWSNSESELFITQSSFSASTSIELSEKQLWILICGCRQRESSWQFNLCTKDLLTDRFTHEDSGQEVTTVTDKEIQARNEWEYHKTLKGQLHGVHEYLKCKGDKSLIHLAYYNIIAPHLNYCLLIIPALPFKQPKPHPAFQTVDLVVM